jgi:N-acetylmuramoyl-L-alanine amidase
MGLGFAPKFTSPPNHNAASRVSALSFWRSSSCSKLLLATLVVTASAAQTPQTPKIEPKKVLKTEVKIVDKPIQFDQERIRLTQDYMRKHYAIEQNDITIKPQAIVLHYTAINSFLSTWNYFNRTRIEAGRPELQRESELNVSAQFLVDRDGTIYRLMPENWMARHCIGLNHVAIGVENVGDEKDFPLTEAQVDADTALVRYLAAEFPIVYLLGHQEYRRMEQTPLFHEEVAGYRTGKSDPGEDFMRHVRANLADLNLKAPPSP